MKIDKKPAVMGVMLCLLALVLIIGTLCFKSLKSSEQPPEQPPEQLSGSSSSTSSDLGVPNIDSMQSKPEKPYVAVDWSDIDKTVLTDDEILTEVDSTLDGLLQLDPAAIDRVSKSSTGGEHNPFRLMFDAVVANSDMKAAFLNMARASSYEILKLERTSTGSYAVAVICTTPYMAGIVTVLAADEQPYPFREFTTFQASGAAAQVTAMDMSAVPLHTDVITLMVIVEHDVPILYHPVSLAYEDTLPQYAFLWGALKFQGVKDGDLLLANHLGGGTEMEEAEQRSNPQLTQTAEYFTAAFDIIKTADISAFSELSLEGVKQGDQIAVAETLLFYRDAFEKHESLETDIINRLKSFMSEIKYYLCKEPVSGAGFCAVAVNYSVYDSLADGQIFYTEYYYLDSNNHSGVSTADAMFVCTFVDGIIEDALGGSEAALIERLLLAETSKGA